MPDKQSASGVGNNGAAVEVPQPRVFETNACACPFAKVSNKKSPKQKKLTPNLFQSEACQTGLRSRLPAHSMLIFNSPVLPTPLNLRAGTPSHGFCPVGRESCTGSYPQSTYLCCSRGSSLCARQRNRDIYSFQQHASGIARLFLHQDHRCRKRFEVLLPLRMHRLSWLVQERRRKLLDR